MKNSSKKDERSCVKCGTCNTVCPVYLATGNEIHSPRGKQHLSPGVHEGERSAHYADIFSKCLLCGACQEACPRELDTPGLVINVRAELPRLSGLSFLKYVSRKALLHPFLLSGITRIGAAANTMFSDFLPPDSGLRLRLLGLKQEPLKPPAASFIDRTKVEQSAGKGRQDNNMEPRVAFFTGCLANHLQPEIAESTQFLVAKTTGSKAHVPLKQTCCGMAALAAGRQDEAQDLAKKNIMAFEENDLPILTSCSSCYFQLQAYDALFRDDPEWRQRSARFTGRLQEFSSFFLKNLSQGSEVGVSSVPAMSRKVHYHDPCHLRFKLHITEEPRQLLKLFKGVDVMELANGPQCCGQGGLFQVAHPGLARQIQTRLLEDFATLPADTVLTACSGCLLQWQLGLGADDRKGQAEHLAVFIARLMQ